MRAHVTCRLSLVDDYEPDVSALLDQALVPEDDRAAFAAMLGEEPRPLTAFNFARYRLTFAAFSAWAGQGRPA